MGDDRVATLLWKGNLKPSLLVSKILPTPTQVRAAPGLQRLLALLKRGSRGSDLKRDSAVVAQLAHNQQVVGSSPTPAISHAAKVQMSKATMARCTK